MVPIPPPRDEEEYGAGLLAPLSSYAGEGSGVRSITTSTAVAHTCGRCAEWLADPEGGRGECLHPGSGILKPWWDTPACPFFH